MKQFADFKGQVVADQTFNAPWIAGTPTADAGTDFITLTGHGLANGDPVEFDAGSGVLPGGIVAYNDDVSAPAGPGGHYYNIIGVSGDTFQICDTVGGAVAVDITSAGTAGWRVRKAGNYPIIVTGLDLNAHLEYDVYFFWGLAKLTTAGVNLYCRLNANADMKYFIGSTWNTNIFIPTAAPTGKYSKMLSKFKIAKKNGLLFITDIVDGGQSSTDKNTATEHTLASKNAIVNDSGVNVTTISFNSNNNAVGIIRNGARALVLRR